MKAMEESRIQASQMLKLSSQSNGGRRYATHPEEVSDFNRFIVPTYEDTIISNKSPSVDVVYGENVQYDSLVND